MYRILIVEDDETIARAIRQHIESWSFEAQCISDFHDVMAQFAQYNPQLVLLDISLPFFNGYYWCEQIRKVSQVPIIFISSAGDNMNIVMAINMGGDDFLAKPFDLSVLMVKIQALLRRSYDYRESAALLEHRGAVLNISGCSLTVCGDKIDLSKNELKILQVLMENKGSVVSRETLMLRLWDSDDFVDDNALTVNVARLRKKLDECGLADFISTKKGFGYMVG